MGSFFRNKLLLLILTGFIAGIGLTLLSHKGIEATSTNGFCEVCHVHPHVFNSWKRSTHYDTPSGIKVDCVECHLPPKGEGYLTEKIKLGAKDIYGFLFKDSAEFNWEARRTVEVAQHFTYQESCVKCHENLFPRTLTKEGQEAHLYYTQKEDELLCLNCHIDVGTMIPTGNTTKTWVSGVRLPPARNASRSRPRSPAWRVTPRPFPVRPFRLR